MADLKYQIFTVPERDNLLPLVSLTRLRDSYVQDGESIQDFFARASCKYASNQKHAQRLYDYVSQQFFMFSTPVMANNNVKKGLGISCYLSSVEDSLASIADHYKETLFLTAAGGGIGGYWGNVRAGGKKSKSNGIVPWNKVVDSLMVAGNQSQTRRGSYATYVPISHPDVLEAISIRDPRGDHARRALGEGFHNAICIPDKFMLAVRANQDWHLIDPHTGVVTDTHNARDLFNKILKTRMETGEPYLFFTDNANKALLPHLYNKGLRITHSNLCNEIYLPTGIDYAGKMRTAICCLSSVNFATYDQWKVFADQMIRDIVEMLDNVLEDFIQNAPPEAANAVYSASMTRDIGLGQMGFHTYLQKHNIPFESEEARKVNSELCYIWSKAARKASRDLGKERGFYPDSMGENGYQHKQRNAHVLAIAPNASSGIICGNVSPSIELWAANCIKNVTMSGTTFFKNPVLEEVLIGLGQNTNAVWSSIIEHEGSVAHLDCLSDHQKKVFKTFIETNQNWVIRHATDRLHHIDQGQSLNIKVRADIDPLDFLMLHFDAWEMGLKGMYYVRSEGLKAGNILTGETERNTIDLAPSLSTDCLMCE